MLRKKMQVILIMFFVLFYCFFTQAKDYKVAVAQLGTTNYYINLLKAIDQETNNNFNIQIVPFARAIYLIETKDFDIQCPQIQVPNEKKEVNLKYDFSTDTLANIVWVLYTNTSNSIDVEEVKKGKNFKIETDPTQIDFFGLSLLPSPNPEASFKKVDTGIIDGYLFTQPSADAVLKKLDLKNIKRQYFNTYPVKFVIQKGTKGGEIDKILSDGLKKLKSNGKYEQILGDYIISIIKI